jgi:guanylate kinase
VSKSKTLPDSPDTSAGPKHLLVILTAPSGSGKTTVLQNLLKREERLSFSVSHTTRPPRTAEVQGRDYHFISESEFKEMLQQGAFAENANVHAHRYGTAHEEIRRLWADDKDILLDIDPQGAMQLLEAYPEAVTIFMTAPTLEELERRLRSRGTESEDQLILRLSNARQEMRYANEYDYFLVNDKVEKTSKDFQAILRAERLKMVRRSELLDALQSPSQSGVTQQEAAE